MAEKVPEIPAISSGVSGEDSESEKLPVNSEITDLIPSTIRQGNPGNEDNESAEEEENRDDSETYREPKRRKKCPAALNKSLPSDTGFSFSFSFDTAICSNESTPKFGSFNAGIDLCAPPPATARGEIPLGFLEAEENGEKKILDLPVPVLGEDVGI